LAPPDLPKYERKLTMARPERNHDELCALNEAYFSGKMTAPDWTTGSRAALPDAPSDKPWLGKSILLDERDLLEPEEQDGPGDSEQGLALMLARKLYSTDEYLQGDFINMSTGIGVSPEFHIMANLAVGGAMDLRTFATLCFLAGRLSLALAQQR
jgi:hypothetical protein